MLEVGTTQMEKEGSTWLMRRRQWMILNRLEKRSNWGWMRITSMSTWWRKPAISDPNLINEAYGLAL